ncbi:MAG: hypothetical protein BWK80_44925 [Desulfobacteraceae bacterium IS3]|nr:MAG: hypothetical protein BWK80_44925 [Desulfobacteraceae bacterium IS3]
MNWFEIAEQIEPELRKGNLKTCIKRVTEELKKMPKSPFHSVVNFGFTNKIRDVAEYFNNFIRKEKERIDIKAIYVEMNGFDINPELWFFDLFAYESFGGHDNYDWLEDWKSEEYESMTLTGLEAIQEVYAKYEDGEYDDDNDFSNARDMCSLLIVLYFQDIIRQSASLIKGLKLPILVTAHEYDFIYEYRKRNKMTEDDGIVEMIKEMDEVAHQIKHLFKDKPLYKMTVREALKSDDPIENIRNEMGEKDIQKLYSLLYAAISEVNSAGAGILFDRYSKEDIETMYNQYKKFGAGLFCSAIDKIRNLMKEKLGETYSDDDYFNLCDTEEYIKLDREITIQYENMCKEMEDALIKFARQNIDALENNT